VGGNRRRVTVLRPHLRCPRLWSISAPLSLVFHRYHDLCETVLGRVKPARIPLRMMVPPSPPNGSECLGCSPVTGQNPPLHMYLYLRGRVLDHVVDRNPADATSASSALTRGRLNSHRNARSPGRLSSFQLGAQLICEIFPRVRHVFAATADGSNTHIDVLQHLERPMPHLPLHRPN
jgi:hypothetical protein